MNLIRFVGGPAHGQAIEVPALTLQETLFVKAPAGGLVMYLDERPGTVEYRRRVSDEGATEYEVVA